MASPSRKRKPHSYSMLLKSLGDQTDQTHKLEEFLSRLEEEKLKIDAFKRELPLCMQLLSNALEASRQQLQTSRANQGGATPKLEEFIPIKNAPPCEAADKATWMNTAQLWSQSGNNETKPNNNIIPLKNTSCKATDVIGFNASPKLGLDNKQRNGGAFLPLSKERNSLRPSLTLAPSTVDKENIMEDNKCSEGIHDQLVKGVGINIISSTDITDGQEGNIVNSNNINGNSTITTSANNSNGSNTSNGQSRKARRCWSPDLHRRFVNALQMLGGSQVATPKQIRELMKVDGLTNDEVKSHLQKYRLHTRRPGPNPQAAVAPTSHLVVLGGVLGGIWIPPEYAAAHGGAPTLYGAHHHTASGPHAAHVPPPNFCSPPPPVTQNFYTAAVPPHHSLHHMYKTAPQHDRLSSPESDDRGSGDCSESIEEGKSDQSTSWEGENGGGRRGLASLREDDEESNGNEITLKF